MTPFLKGKSEKKVRWLFYFSIDRSKITPKSMQEELEEFGFKKRIKDVIPEKFDFIMSIRLEDSYNETKFAKQILKKYSPLIMEIEVKKP